MIRSLFEKVDMEQLDWLRNHLHCNVQETSQTIKFWQDPLTYKSMTNLDPDATVKTVPVYKVELKSTDLEYMIRALRSYHIQQEMVNHHPQVRDAWLQMQTLISFLNMGNQDV